MNDENGFGSTDPKNDILENEMAVFSIKLNC
jgi:hypothetical protein